ncbi:hypothetical protein [Variovorax sp. PAMC26660]|uniref:hypothetical protein n=1 Tax=Variovorax sp. PAMC26660 TaxID=2762322 RepID=UPI00164D8CBA|nr:hypothetical protein [Variovorax sp. PAMC26660]QNK68798.1 hypothetical protein H7F35_03410 [Variovorax sp. PAMC26660]
MTQPAASPPSRLHRAGIVILIAGWVVAAFLFVLAERNEDGMAADQRVVNGQVYTVPLDASKRELQEVERMGGKATVWMVESEAWLGSLFHGKRLAYTLAVLSSVVAGACIYLAALAAEEVGE